MIELVICLGIFLLLLFGTVQLAILYRQQTALRAEARSNAGQRAILAHANGAGATNEETITGAISRLSRANALTHLERFTLPEQSTLPASHYTLANRTASVSELNHQTERNTRFIPLDEAFLSLIPVQTPTIQLTESVTFPSLSGLFQPTAAAQP